MQADGYAGFDELYSRGGIVEAACWAHVRRKLEDVDAATKSALPREALERITAIYAIERDIRGKSPGERRQARQTRSAPLMLDLQ